MAARETLARILRSRSGRERLSLLGSDGGERLLDIAYAIIETEDNEHGRSCAFFGCHRDDPAAGRIAAINRSQAMIEFGRG